MIIGGANQQNIFQKCIRFFNGQKNWKYRSSA